MKITITNLGPTKVSINVEADNKELEPLKKHVLKHFASSVKVPGFRAGTAPLAMLEKHIDQRAFVDEFLDHAINDLYKKTIENEKLRPVGEPKLSVKKFVPYTLLEFVTEQEVIGKVKLPAYKTMKLAEPKVEVTEADMTEVLKNMQTRMSEKVESSMPAKTGDETVIDFYGTDLNGEAIPGADGKAYALTLGSGTFIPGFEEQVLGLKTGDEKEFKITFPADYQAKELQNKKVNFKVNVITVNQVVAQKLDDVFAAKVGPFKNLSELKADIKKQLLEEKKFQAQRDYEGQLIRKISEKSTLSIPESLIDEQVRRSEDEEKRNLMYRGQTWEEHLSEEKVTEKQHRERNRPEAEERVKASLVLSEISELEKIDVTPAELEERITVLRDQYKDEKMRSELDKPENRRDIAARLLTDKTLAKLRAYATK